MGSDVGVVWESGFPLILGISLEILDDLYDDFPICDNVTETKIPKSVYYSSQMVHNISPTWISLK